MAKLPKYTVEYDEKKEKWVLEKDKSNAVLKQTNTKDEMTAGGVLKKALGEDGGSVKIQKLNGRFQREVTFPKKADPIESRG